MNLSSFSIKRKVTTFMFYTAILVFGIMSFNNLSLDLMPSIDIPIAVVSTSYSGAAPQEVETMVTKTLESALAVVSGIEDISSSSSEGSSLIVVSFSDDTNLDTALTDMREKIDLVTPYLPDSVSSPIVMAIDPNAMAILEIALAGDDLTTLKTFAEDIISPELERIEGVASVDVSGGYESSVTIDVKSETISGYGISLDYISQILMAQNISMPSGTVTSGNSSITVRTSGAFETIDDIKDTLIPLPTGGTVKLDELATVDFTSKDVSTIAKNNGVPSVVISVQKQSDVNTVQVANKVNDAVATLSDKYPTIDMATIFDQSDFINLAVDSVMNNIILGILAAVIVLLFFLKSVRSTFVIAISMPLCIIGTFLLMNTIDITMNMMSLGGIAMGVGMIVDNSVVVLENIYRFMKDGYDRSTACVEGAKEVALSISASTLTTIAVFLPIGLSGGITGMMFQEFCITIAALLLISLIIALTLVPVLAYFLLHPKTNKKTKESKLKLVYQKALAFNTKHKFLALVFCFAILAGFSYLSFTHGLELIPSIDQGTISVTIDTPSGTSPEDVSAISDKYVSKLESISEIDNIFYSTSGTSSTLTIAVSDKEEREKGIEDIAQEMRVLANDIAGAEFSVSSAGSFDMSALTGDAISISISGNDFDTLELIVNDIIDIVENIDGVAELSSSVSDRVPQVTINLKNEIATKFGLTSATVGSSIYSQLLGTTATTLTIDGTEIDVIVRGDNTDTDIDSLQNLLIPTQMGTSVPLSVIADVEIELGPTVISRENQARTVSITGSAYDVDVTALTATIDDKISQYAVPEGYIIEIGGESEAIAEAFDSMYYALVVAIALVYFILASQFESLILPFIVMLILPLGLTGGLFGNSIMGYPVSMPAFIGVIMLSGVVVNNSIVLIDYISIRRSRGEDRKTAILNACPLRVRPVLMTTLTTALGLLPMALGYGDGSEIMVPMSIVMISGLLISTVVTLLFTPVFYVILDDISSIFTKRNKKEKTNI